MARSLSSAPVNLVNIKERMMKALCILMTIVLLAAAPIFLWAAEDGAALYDSKCSMCHGEKGEGNPPSLPKVAGTSMTVEKLVTYLTKGDNTKTVHKEPTSDLNEDQAKAIAEYLKKLK
jgi:cytochrome c553